LRIEKIEEISVSIEDESPPDVDYAILNIYRHSGQGALVNYDLYLGETFLCRVKNNHYESIKIYQDGMNTIWARTESKTEIPVKIKFGKEYYLRCGITIGIMVGHPKLELVDEQTGRIEIESLKRKKK